MLPARNARFYRYTFATLVALVFVYRAWFMSALPLSGDEAYHWEWSRRPAAGYYDHPGLTAYLIRLSTALLGRSTEFSVRLPALLCLLLSTVVAYAFSRRIARERGLSATAAERAGFLAGVLLLFVPVFAVFSVYMSTDPPLLLFWTVTLYLADRAVKDGAWRDWLGLGVAVGLAMLSKFLAFFLVPVLGLFVLICPENRRWFRRPQGYVAAGLALLTFSPFLWWNATHGWATFVFNFMTRQKYEPAGLRYLAEFAVTETVAFSPGLLLFGLYGAFRALREYRREGGRSALLLGLAFAVPFTYFLLQSFTRRIGAHWPTVAKIGMLVYLPYDWERTAADGPRRTVQRLKRWSVGLCVALTALLHVGVFVPLRLAQRPWFYSGMPDRINTRVLLEFFGWDLLGARVQAVYDQMLQAQRARRGVFVICPRYGVAAAVAFYTPRQLRTHLWAPRRTHGENYRFWDDYASMKGQDAIFVTKKGLARVESQRAHLRGYFDTVADPEPVPVVVGGREVRRFHLVRCRGFNGQVPQFRAPEQGR